MGQEGVSRMNLTLVAGVHCSIHQQGLGPGPKHPHAEEEGIGTWQPMSGYEIKRLVEMGLRHFWNESYGQLYPTLAALVDDEALVTELGLTSLQVMSMIEQIEDHFDISIPLNILPDIRTVRDLAQQLADMNK